MLIGEVSITLTRNLLLGLEISGYRAWAVTCRAGAYLFTGLTVSYRRRCRIGGRAMVWFLLRFFSLSLDEFSHRQVSESGPIVSESP